jgi:hypothetical protein
MTSNQWQALLLTLRYDSLMYKKSTSNYSDSLYILNRTTLCWFHATIIPVPSDLLVPCHHCPRPIWPAGSMPPLFPSHLTCSTATTSHFANSLDTAFNEPVLPDIPATAEGSSHPQLLHLVYTQSSRTHCNITQHRLLNLLSNHSTAFQGCAVVVLGPISVCRPRLANWNKIETWACFCCTRNQWGQVRVLNIKNVKCMFIKQEASAHLPDFTISFETKGVISKLTLF